MDICIVLFAPDSCTCEAGGVAGAGGLGAHSGGGRGRRWGGRPEGLQQPDPTLLREAAGVQRFQRQTGKG